MSSTKRREPPKQRNPHARALESNLFRARVKPSGKLYRRKGRKPQ
jgi:hypothetical protein